MVGVGGGGGGASSPSLMSSHGQQNIGISHEAHLNVSFKA